MWKFSGYATAVLQSSAPPLPQARDACFGPMLNLKHRLFAFCINKISRPPTLTVGLFTMSHELANYFHSVLTSYVNIWVIKIWNNRRITTLHGDSYFPTFNYADIAPRFPYLLCLGLVGCFEKRAIPLRAQILLILWESHSWAVLTINWIVKLQIPGVLRWNFHGAGRKFYHNVAVMHNFERLYVIQGVFFVT